MLNKTFNIVSILFFLLIGTASAQILINEIMYNPSQNENYNEWIELYNNGTSNVDISNYTICQKKIFSGFINKTNKTLEKNESFILKIDSYALITDGVSGTEVYNNFNVSDDSIALHVETSSICGELSNSGKEIILSDSFNNFSYFYNDTVREGYSLEYVNNTFIESFEFNGTPGRKNTAFIIIYNNMTNDTIDKNITNESNYTNNNTDIVDNANYTNEIYPEIDFDIDISPSNYSLIDYLNITGNITVTPASNLTFNLTIKIAKNNNGSYTYRWYVLNEKEFKINSTTNITTLLMNSSIWKIPDDFITGNYKILATLKHKEGNSTKYKYSDKSFFVNGLEDLGEYNLSIITMPLSMRFGDIKNVLIKLDTNNYNLKNVSIVAYVYSPKWASIDLNDDTLMTRPYNSNVALKFDDIPRASVNYFSIPILSKRNCENEYSDGVYFIKVRVYEDANNIIEDSFNMTISSLNDAMCPKNIETKSSASSKSSQSAISCPTIANSNNDNIVKESEEFTYDKTKFEIKFSNEIKDFFEVNISAKNSDNISKDFEITSYVLSSRTKISDVVKDSLKLEKNESKILMIKGDITSKDFGDDVKLIIKINSSNRKTDKILSIPISIAEIKEKDIDIKKYEIVSFYLKKTNSSDDTTVEVISNCTKNQKLVLEGFSDYIEVSCKKTSNFKIKMSKEKNLFFLSLVENNTIYDVKRILINLDSGKIEIFDNSLKNYENTPYNSLTSEKYVNLLSGNAVKQSVIYESTNEKLKKLIKYLVPIVFIIGIIIVIWGKKNG